MSDSRLTWLKSPTVRALLLALVAVGAAFAFKAWKDWSDAAPSREQEAVAARLAQALDAIEAAADDDAQAALDALPQRTAWHPVVPCGPFKAAFGAAPESWKGLPKTGWEGKQVSHSFRFHVEGKQAVFLARRDADCDGLYELHRVSMAPSLVGGWSKSEPSTQNRGD